MRADTGPATPVDRYICQGLVGPIETPPWLRVSRVAPIDPHEVWLHSARSGCTVHTLVALSSCVWHARDSLLERHVCKAVASTVVSRVPCSRLGAGFRAPAPINFFFRERLFRVFFSSTNPSQNQGGDMEHGTEPLAANGRPRSPTARRAANRRPSCQPSQRPHATAQRPAANGQRPSGGGAPEQRGSEESTAAEEQDTRARLSAITYLCRWPPPLPPTTQVKLHQDGGTASARDCNRALSC